HKNHSAHHAVEKGICLYFKLPRPVVSNLHPLRLSDSSHGCAFRSSRGTEGREIVRSNQEPCGACKENWSDRRLPPPGITFPNGVTQWLTKQAVTITAGCRIKAWVKFIIHHFG